jgi:hypothetical protein
MTTANIVLPTEAVKILFDNLEPNEKRILVLYRDNLESSFTQEDVKKIASLSTNDARVSLYKLEAVLFIIRNIKGRGNSYVLSENGKRIIRTITNQPSKG